MREHWKEVVQEQAAVELVSLGPEHEEADTSLFPATRFFCQLEEDFFPIHFNFTIDSDSDFLHPYSPSQTITQTLRLGDIQPSFIPTTQVSALLEVRDSNNDTPAPDSLAQDLLPGQQLLYGASLERWLEADLHPEPVVLRPFNSTQCIFGRYKRQREELEQEKALREKRTHKQYKHKIH